MAATIALNADNVGRARTLIGEAVAIQELVTRVSGDNHEDFDMVQRACNVTFRLVEEAGSLLEDRSHV